MKYQLYVFVDGAARAAIIFNDGVPFKEMYTGEEGKVDGWTPYTGKYVPLKTPEECLKNPNLSHMRQTNRWDAVESMLWSLQRKSHPNECQITKRILVKNTHNGFESNNSPSKLIEVPADLSLEIMQNLEKTQIGVYRIGGNLEEIMISGNISYKLISEGRFNTYKKEDYDEIYTLIAGNY